MTVRPPFVLTKQGYMERRRAVIAAVSSWQKGGIYGNSRCAL